MSLLPKSIHRCRRYPTKFNSGRDIPEAGQIVVVARTRELAADAFEVRDLGTVSLKGKRKAVQVFEVLSEKGGETKIS